MSKWSHVKSGIPQGSVLGPILFVLYINDMPSEIKNYCKLFADDAKIFSSVTKDDFNLQDDINQLATWSENYGNYRST